MTILDLDASEVLKLVGFLGVAFFSLFVVIRLLRFLGILNDIAEETAEAVYTTGTSPESFLLKVIITILFPPILIFYLVRLLRQVMAFDGDEEEQARKEKIETERKKENERLWRDNP